MLRTVFVVRAACNHHSPKVTLELYRPGDRCRCPRPRAAVQSTTLLKLIYADSVSKPSLRIRIHIDSLTAIFTPSTPPSSPRISRHQCAHRPSPPPNSPSTTPLLSAVLNLSSPIYHAFNSLIINSRPTPRYLSLRGQGQTVKLEKVFVPSVPTSNLPARSLYDYLLTLKLSFALDHPSYPPLF